MRVEVCELTHDVEEEASVEEERARWVFGSRRRRAVDPESNVETSKSPVVAAVLEDVEGRHGCKGEAVDEEGFEFAFDEVEGDQDA